MLHLLSVCLLLLAAEDDRRVALPRRTTLLQVLATPEKHDDQQVHIIGYLHLEFEGDHLYLHKEDFDHGLGNSIWVDVTPDMRQRINDINDKYVIIEGVFDADHHGHLGASLGAITKITRCDVWSDPQMSRRVKGDTRRARLKAEREARYSRGELMGSERP